MLSAVNTPRLWGRLPASPAGGLSKTTTDPTNHSTTKPQQPTLTNGMLTTTNDPHNKWTKNGVRSTGRMVFTGGLRARSAETEPAPKRSGESNVDYVLGVAAFDTGRRG